MSPVQSLHVLRQRKEFLAVAAQGKKWVSPGVIVQLSAPGASPSVIRYGLTASSKIGNAVKRNRARRRLRALACEILPLHAAPGHDYVLIARAATIKRPFADLRADLMSALKKLEAWHD